MKNIIFIVTIALFSFTGCGAGGSSNISSNSNNFDITSVNIPYSVANTKALATKSNVQKLTDTVISNKNSRIIGRSISSKTKTKTNQFLLQDLILSTISKAKNSPKTSKLLSTSSNSCVDYRVTSSSSYYQSATLSYNNCYIDGTYIDGVLYLDTYTDEMEITFATNMSFTTNGTTTKIYKGGQIVVDNLIYNYYDSSKIDSMRVISSLFLETDGAISGSHMLVATFEKQSNIRLKYCIHSGKQYIDNGYFTVNPNSTCMIFDNNTLIPSGTFKYSGVHGSKVEIQATDYDQLTLSKDEDGDGVFEYSEDINL